MGERSTVREPGEDPRGALNARIAEADYPFLNANLMRREGGEHAGIGAPSVMIERAGVSIGVIGVTTEQTLTTTISANVSDLAIRSLADAIASEAATLRERGAALVLVAAHAGGRCHHFESPDDLSSCDADQEIWQVAQALPAGTVDVIVAGHTHQGVAHRVNGIAIIESFSYGHAFGRVDVTLSRPDRAILDVHIHPPQGLCSRRDADPEGALERCAPPDYEGQDVMPDAEVAQVIEPSMTRAAALRDRDLGVVLTHAFTRDRSRENALGNLFTDLMLRARPSADVAVVNGGGLRANLAEGPLTYGELYESFPFDNRFATIRMPASELALMLGRHLSREGSFWSIGGLRARAVCRRGALDVSLVRENGRPVRPTEEITVLTSDFLATGGDGAFERAREREGAVTIEDDPPIREAMVEVLAGLAPRAHSGGSAPRPQLDPGSYYDRERPRVQFDGELPLRCSR